MSYASKPAPYRTTPSERFPEVIGRPLSILVDGRVMQDRYHGIGRYAFELLREMSRLEVELVIVYNPDSGRLDLEELISRPNVKAAASNVPVVSFRSQWELLRAIRKFRPDAVFMPYHLSTPLMHGSVPVVSVIQDCIFERKAFEQGRSSFSLAYGAATRLAIHSASALLTPSQASRYDICRFYGLEVPAEAIVPYGVGAQFFRAPDRPRSRNALIPDHYILHVGARRPHKNQRVLVEALSRLRPGHPDLELVLVGQLDPRVHDEVDELIETLDLSERVRQYTDADDELLQDLYAHATIFAFPSLIEGFGLPILEAMAAGLPVVASDAQAVQEVAGTGALIVPARETESWVEALDKVLSDPHFAEDLRERARVVAAGHTWAHSAELTLAALASAVEEAGGRKRRA